VQTKAMPLGNVTGMTQAERDLLGAGLHKARESREHDRDHDGDLRFSRGSRRSWRRRRSRRSDASSVRRPGHPLPLERESNWIPWGDRELGIGPENATSYHTPASSALPGRPKRNRAALSIRVLLLRSKADTCGRTISRRSSKDRSCSGARSPHALEERNDLVS